MATYPGHAKSHSALADPIPRRSITEGGHAASPLTTRDLAKPRSRASILSTFRTWFDDGRRKRKTGSSLGALSNTPSGGIMASKSAPAMAGYFPADGGVGMPDHPYTPRNKRTGGKGTGPRRGGRAHKDKRPSISSRRSSSVNSRRSSAASLASMANIPGALGSVGEYAVYNGASLTRRMSDGSRRSYGAGAKTPIEEDLFDPSRPASARSLGHGTPVTAGIAKRGKRHSKSSSTSSGGSLGRRVPTRPPSRSETASPTGTKSRVHHRVGSGSSQTRMVKHHGKKTPSISQSMSGGTEAPASESQTGSQKRGRVRSGSVSSVQSGGSSALGDDAEFGGRRTGSPLRSGKGGVMGQKKHNAYTTTPNGSLGYITSRSSWKRSWGQEPPGWANRAANQGVIIEILDNSPKGNVRDVFAGGGKSGWAPGTSPPSDGNEDDWSDVDDDVQFAGGLGQLGSVLGATNATGLPAAANHVDSPLMVFANSSAGRRTKRVVSPAGPFGTKTNGSPLPAANSLPSTSTNSASAPVGMDSLGLERAGSRRNLPAGRSGFRGPAIVEEEEEEED
jgi:hypothetical protein